MIEVVAKIFAGHLVNKREEENSWIDSMLSEYSEEDRSKFDMRFEERKKTVGMGYTSWLFALQYAYIGAWVRLAFFILTLGGFMMWHLMDAILMPLIIASANRKIKMKIIDEILEENLPEDLEAGVPEPAV